MAADPVHMADQSVLLRERRQRRGNFTGQKATPARSERGRMRESRHVCTTRGRMGGREEGGWERGREEGWGENGSEEGWEGGRKGGRESRRKMRKKTFM